MSSTINRKDLMNEAVDAAFISTGVVALSMASKKMLGGRLTDASSMKDIGKLALGVTLSTMLVKYAQSKKGIPEDPFKTT